MLIKKYEPPPHKIETFLFQWRNWLYETYKHITRQQPYGGYFQYEIATVVVVTATNTYYLVAGNSVGPLSEMSFASNALTILHSGKYLVTTSISIADAGSTEYETAIHVGGVKNQMSAAHASTSGTLILNITGTAVISLNAGNVVDLRIANRTNLNDPTIRHCAVTLVWLS